MTRFDGDTGTPVRHTAQEAMAPQNHESTSTDSTEKAATESLSTNLSTRNSKPSPVHGLRTISRGSGRPLSAVVKGIMSSDSASAAEDGPSLGHTLRAARMAAGYTQADMAHLILMSEAQINALEECHWDRLPEPVYVTGGLKRFARHVGLDVAETLATYKAEAKPADPNVFDVPETMRKENSTFARAFMAASFVLMAALGYGVWSVSTQDAREWTAATPPVPDRLATLVEMLPEEKIARSGGIDEANASVQPYGALGLPQPPVQQVYGPTQAPGQSLADTVFEISTPAVQEPAGVAAARVILRAREDSWVQIEGDGAELIMTRVLRAGEEYPVPARDDLVMITGNAGGVEVLLDGRSLGVLGKRGDIRRDISLSADSLATGAPLSAN